MTGSAQDANVSLSDESSEREECSAREAGTAAAATDRRFKSKARFPPDLSCGIGCDEPHCPTSTAHMGLGVMPLLISRPVLALLPGMRTSPVPSKSESMPAHSARVLQTLVDMFEPERICVPDLALLLGLGRLHCAVLFAEPRLRPRWPHQESAGHHIPPGCFQFKCAAFCRGRRLKSCSRPSNSGIFRSLPCLRLDSALYAFLQTPPLSCASRCRSPVRN